MGFIMARSKLLSSAIGAAFMAATCAATPALALDTGCAPREVVMKALSDEDQAPIISGKRLAIDFPKNIFTANATLTLGYNVEAGKGDETGLLCVRAKYTNIRLNSDAKLSRPSWASFGSDTDHDKYLSSVEAKANDKVLMGATALIRSEDGTEAPGRFIMVVRGDATTSAGTSVYFKNSGASTATSSRGAISTLLTMADIDTTSNFGILAKNRVQSASADTTSYRPR